MKRDDITQNYFAIIKKRLIEDKFRIITEVSFSDHKLLFMAKKAKFKSEYMAFVSEFFFFTYFDDINKSTLIKYSSDCLRYARRQKTIPYLYLPFESVVCFPVLVTHDFDRVIAKDLKNSKPKWHFADYEFPVIVDLRNNKIYYPEKTRHWGKWIYESFWPVVRSMLSPQLAGLDK